ncbi:MAG: response regulator transcription factor, partial [Geminicoccaceae bacterium]|nr:response regulator transcription factor [Geminicoccaceae bacterium]
SRLGRAGGTGPCAALGWLTPRQREVLELLGQGRPNKVIAQRLAMCESTVKVHVRQIMRKLGARNRTEVALKLRELTALG